MDSSYDVDKRPLSIPFFQRGFVWIGWEGVGIPLVISAKGNGSTNQIKISQALVYLLEGFRLELFQSRILGTLFNGSLPENDHFLRGNDVHRSIDLDRECIVSENGDFIANLDNRVAAYTGRSDCAWSDLDHRSTNVWGSISKGLAMGEAKTAIDGFLDFGH